MRHQHHAVGLGERGDLAELGDAAQLGDARLSVGDRAGREHLPELERGAGVLAGGQGDADLGLEPGECAEVLGREDRLLEPMEVVGLELERHLARLARRPGAVGVEHKGHAIAGRLARRLDLGLGRLVQLDVGIALGQRRARPLGHDLGVVVLE